VAAEATDTRKEHVMSTLKTLTASALAVAALAPAAASAAGVELRGAPSLRLVDARQANLSFTTDERLPRKANGTYRVRIVFASGRQKVSSVVARGRHGDDYRYGARVRSTSDLRVGAKYTVRFGDDDVTRRVKLHDEHD
jgi:hypothetical protein